MYSLYKEELIYTSQAPKNLTQKPHWISKLKISSCPGEGCLHLDSTLLTPEVGDHWKGKTHKENNKDKKG